VAFFNERQPEVHIPQLPARVEHISQETLGFARGQFEITTPICMHELEYSFPL